MDFRQLATFRVLAGTLNFHQAADHLHCVQSTVTAQIQALEDELGARLFDRLGRRIALTDAGARLLPYAEQLIKGAEEARLAVSGREEHVGTLTVSATETLCTYRLPAVFHRFRMAYPLIRLVFFTSRYSELRRAVAEGKVDLAFVMEESITATALHAEPLFAEPIHLVASPDHPFAQRPVISPSDLERETVLMTEAGCSYRVQFQHQLNTAGVQPGAMLEFDSIEAIKRCAMIGMGIAFLPAIAVAAEISQSKLVILSWRGEPIRMVTQIVRHKQKWLSPSIQAFLRIVKQVFMDSGGKPVAVRRGTGRLDRRPDHLGARGKHAY
jgi:DNA-binding transcriptional LysR family regulator